MKYQDLRKRIKRAIFTRQDLRLRGLKVFDYQFSLWQKQGYITRLKNGVYLFSEEAESVKPEELARHLYSPSYISLEKALSIYGLIPEMVYGITSITPKTTRRFKNRFGNFIYRHIKPALFFGYRERNGYLMADPEKALLDYLYLNRVRTGAAFEGLRLNRKLTAEIYRPAVLSKYLKAFDDKALKELLNAFF